MRKFLVLMDDSKECLNAIRYAAMRVSKSGGGVVVLAVIPTKDIQHGFGVADLMRAEARERIESHYEVYAKWMRNRPGVDAQLVIREGDPAEELLAQVNDDPEIGIVALGLNVEKGGPNPVFNRLLRDPGQLSVPITLVPGDLSKDRLEVIT
ncbi:universal stress protein [Paracoccus sp. (in: a-proteobacteria)]|uniref:universal stress protein n=1 Tax=Paracoccus sp. TaxID=267 RepID=UPI0026DF1DB0|nr:universal stress protein [Paracoccus sp. (in: a-proteobacteria)]MDO5647203.1 universal stress protein [Paracoccus sp. (in: a-proteobacteria)]